MQKLGKIALFLSICTSILVAQTNRYDIKSGIVEYEIIGVSEAKNHTVDGTVVLYFKDFGKLELVDERIVQKRAGFDDEVERNIYKITKDKLLTVDFNDEVIYSQALSYDDDNPISNIKNRETLTQMGAKFVANENILGYKCDVWELGEYKIWVYNSVILKQISKSEDMIQMQIAKNANFNIDVKDNKFKLPNFPVKAIDVIIGESED